MAARAPLPRAGAILAVVVLLPSAAALLPAAFVGGMHARPCLAQRSAFDRNPVRTGLPQLAGRPQVGRIVLAAERRGRGAGQGGEGIGPGQPPAKASKRQMRYLLLQRLLQEVVSRQDFEGAAEIRAEMRGIEKRELEDLSAALLQRVTAMRKERGGSAAQARRLSRAQRVHAAMRRALELQQFQRAARLAQMFPQANGSKGEAGEGASPGGRESQPAAQALLRRLDMVWVEQELNKEVINVYKELRDLNENPGKLEEEMKRLADAGNYEQAAEIRDQLRRLVRHLDNSAMLRELRSQLTIKRAQIRRMLTDEVKTIEYRIQLAVAAENFESAARLLRRLRAAEAKRMFAVLKRAVQRQSIGQQVPVVLSRVDDEKAAKSTGGAGGAGGAQRSEGGPGQCDVDAQK